MPFFIEVMTKDHVDLAWSFNVNKNADINNDTFENQLRTALTDMQQGMNVTHLLVERDDNGKLISIIGYVTLRINILTNKVYETARRYPAIEIQYLAVDSRYERKGFGRVLAHKAIDVAFEIISKYFGGLSYIVLSSAKSSVDFYSKVGFEKINNVGEIETEDWNNSCTQMFAKIDLNAT